jgi:hypothetical protein
MHACQDKLPCHQQSPLLPGHSSNTLAPPEAPKRASKQPQQPKPPHPQQQRTSFTAPSSSPICASISAALEAAKMAPSSLMVVLPPLPLKPLARWNSSELAW